MKRIQGFLIGLVVAIALPALAYKVTDSIVTFGTNGDVTLNLGGGQFKWNNSTNKLEQSNDGGATSAELGTAGKVKFDKSQYMEIHTGDGAGSSGDNNKVRKFLTLARSSGDGVYTHNHGSYGGSGLEITMLKDAKIEGKWCDQANVLNRYAISVNVNLASDMNSISYAGGIRGKQSFDTATNGDYACITFDFEVDAGDIIRPVAQIANYSTSSPHVYFNFRATSIETVDSTSLTIGHFKGGITWENEVGCFFETASLPNVWQDFGSEASCGTATRTVKGDATDSSSGLLPQLTFASLKKGHYQIFVQGKVGSDSNNINQKLRITDGVNSSIGYGGYSLGAGDTTRFKGAVFSLDYATDQTNVTLKLQGQTDNNGSIYAIDATNSDFEIMVYYQPTVDDSEFLVPLNIGKSAEWANLRTLAGYSSNNTSMPYYTTTSVNTFNELATFENSSANGIVLTALQKIKVTAEASTVNNGSGTHHNGWVVNATEGQKDTSILDAGMQAIRVGSIGYGLASVNTSKPISTILDIGDTLTFHTDTDTLVAGDANFGGYIVAEPADVEGVIAKNSAPIVGTFYEKNNTGTDLSAGSWQTMSLNTADSENDSTFSLASDQITINKVGRYLLSGSSNFYMSANAVVNTSFRLYDVTNAQSYSDDLGFANSYPISATYGGALRTIEFRPTIINVTTAPQTFRIEGYPEGGNFSNGSGNSPSASGTTAIRSHISIMKLQ